MRTLWALLGSAVLVTGCSAGSPSVGEATSATCEPAPGWLVDEVQRTITTAGATIERALVVPAGKIQSGPPDVLGPDFADARLFVGIITGGDAADETAIWITNGTAADDRGLILAVSAAARRLSNWGADVQQDIAAEGEIAARHCVE